MDLLRRRRAALGCRADNPLESAPWLGAWAPGGGERVLAKDIGIPLEAGSRIIMQVHYNLIEGSHPDTSSTRLRLAPGSADLAALETMLLPAPVELACRSNMTGPLCDRAAAVRDVAHRFGGQSGLMVAGLQFLCGGDAADPKASPVQTCDRTMRSRSHRPGGRRAHAPPRPVDLRDPQPRHGARTRPARHPGLELRRPGGEIAPQAREDPARRRPPRQVPARPGTPRRGPRARGRRPSGTSSGARAPPTRCASASSWSPNPARIRRVCRV